MAKKETSQKEPVFTKEQVLVSKKFTPSEKDFLRAILEESKTYTVDQARNVLEKTLSKEVK